MVLDEIPKAKRSFASVGVGLKEVVTVPSTLRTFEAFEKLEAHCVNAVGVIDPNTQTLIGNLSVSDLKIVGYDWRDWDLLGSPVGSFLRTVHTKTGSDIRSRSFKHRATQLKNPEEFLVHCSPEDPLSAAFQKATLFRVHRIYLTDENRKPVGVVTLSDLLETFVPKEEKAEVGE